MIKLEKDKVYTIKTLDDLLNCPLNMYGDAIKAIGSIWEKRLDSMRDLGKEVDIKCSYIDLKNDGIDKATIIGRVST